MSKSTIIVDDTEYMRAFIRETLMSARIPIVGEAEDGESGLALYRNKQPELMILNIVMPKLSGLEVLKQIRAWDPNAKIIICSAMAQASTVFSAIQAGASEFLVKPFTAEDLLKAVQRVTEEPLTQQNS